jgi:hypothetical protein
MKYVGKIYHDLRRSALRNFVRADVPEGLAIMISDHETRDVFDRYNTTSGKDIEETGRKLDENQKKLAQEVAVGDGHTSGTLDGTSWMPVTLLN